LPALCKPLGGSVAAIVAAGQWRVITLIRRPKGIAMNRLPVLAALFAPALLISAEQDLAKPINTICPVDGMAIDQQRDPIVVSDTTGGRTELVPVGVCVHQTCADAVRTHPEDYLQAARQDRIARVRNDDAALRERRLDDQPGTVSTEVNPGKAAETHRRGLLDNERPNAIDLAGQADRDAEGGERR
jgi:hypothetical protein